MAISVCGVFNNSEVLNCEECDGDMFICGEFNDVEVLVCNLEEEDGGMFICEEFDNCEVLDCKEYDGDKLVCKEFNNSEVFVCDPMGICSFVKNLIMAKYLFVILKNTMVTC